MPSGVTVDIGDKIFFNGRVYITSPVCEGRSIHIGKHNLFADRILFMGRNAHGIFDSTTHKQINIDQDLFLGDRNWICKDAEFYPKAHISNDCVVAAHTVVNKPFSECNILVAGIPAKIKRKNIVWNISCDIRKLEEKPYNPLYTKRPD